MTAEGARFELGGKAGFNNGVGALDSLCEYLYLNADFDTKQIRNMKITDFGRSNQELKGYVPTTGEATHERYYMPSVSYNQDGSFASRPFSFSTSKQLGVENSYDRRNLQITPWKDGGQSGFSLGLDPKFIGALDVELCWLSTRNYWRRAQGVGWVRMEYSLLTLSSSRLCELGGLCGFGVGHVFVSRTAAMLVMLDLL